MAMYKKAVSVTTKVAMFIASLGLAGLFLSGAFMNTFLKIIPLIGHQIVGWVLIIVAVLGAINEIKK